MSEQTAVPMSLCDEKHRNVNVALAVHDGRINRVETVLNGNGHPEDGIVAQTVLNTQFREQTQDLITSLNKTVYRNIATTIITTIGTIASVLYLVIKSGMVK